MEYNFWFYEGQGKHTLNGECPHCRHKSNFFPVTNFHEEPVDVDVDRLCAAFKCAACGGLILGILTRTRKGRFHEPEYHEVEYEEHYPLGAPDDSFEEGIPPYIGENLSEALRCRSVNAFNATTEMCRRALEASCLALGADPKDKLDKQIDWVYSQGKIISSLRDMAHKIRLGGNRGAHPPDHPEYERPLTEEEADAVIEFTRDYLRAVYVMPTKISKFDFSRSSARKKLNGDYETKS